MIITIKPEDIIKRCLWSDYRRFALKNLSEEEIAEIIEKNEPTVISEEIAFVIGLLKYIETDNLVHRFNLYLLENLQIKSNLYDDNLYINKNVIIKDVVSFKYRFPEAYKAEKNYITAIQDVVEYIDALKEKMDGLNIKYIVNNEKTYECLSSNEIKKLLSL
jgi:hypothetical protein